MVQVSGTLFYRNLVFGHHYELVQNDPIVRSMTVLAGTQSKDPCMRNQGSHHPKRGSKSQAKAKEEA